MLRPAIPVVGCLALAVSVPLIHEWTLSKARRQRIAEESQIASLRQQLEDARTTLGELRKLNDVTPIHDQRLQKVESTLSTAGTQLASFDSRIQQSLRALDALEQKTSALARNASEGALRETTKVVENVRSSLQRDIVQTESKLRDELKRLESSEVAAKETRDLAAMDAQILRPIVQLNGEDTVGSGVLVYSGKDSTGKPSTLVLSSYHVVRNILAEGGEGAATKGIKLNVYRSEVPTPELADVVAVAEDIDLVLLKLRGEAIYEHVARMLPPERLGEVKVFTPIYAVGCPLGNDPIPTLGEIASTRNVIAGHNYWMLNAPTYFGNSGGGVFLSRTHEMIGIFSKIYTHGAGRPTVIPHMGLATPMETVAGFLRGRGYGFVVDGAVAKTPGPKSASEASTAEKKL